VRGPYAARIMRANRAMRKSAAFCGVGLLD
jgi:hypothetical protein